jgi:CHASE2 domain-containing sensor protein
VLFSFDNLMITIATIGVIGLAYILPRSFDFLDPVGEALGDMDITDMVFSKFRDELENGVDTNIVLINVGLVGRADIAYILDRINEHEPRAVGLDIFFRTPKDPVDDSLLMDAMKDTKNLVLVSKVAFKEESIEGQVNVWEESDVDPDREYDTLETSDPMFGQYASTGFANMFIDQESSFMTVREASLKETCNGTLEPSFALKLSEFIDRGAAQRALNREGELEVINYHGGLSSYYHFDVDQVLDPSINLSVVRDKVVLLGYMGPDVETPSLEDIFYTPLNENYVGRSFPDMYGVVIHANVISMIVRENYIGRMSTEASFLIGLLVLVMNVMMFTYMYTRFENWYDVFAVSMQLLESTIIVFLIVVVFDKLNYKLVLTPALISVFLVGTVHDLYQDSIKKIILSSWDRVAHRKNNASNS